MRQNYTPKPLFVERMKELLGKAEFGRYKKAIEKPVLKSLRVNTLKISIEELKKKLEAKEWKISQPFKKNPEIFIVEGKYSIEKKSEYNPVSDGRIVEGQIKRTDLQKKLVDLEPGELGRALEHMLGYYYLQEIASMLPAIVLSPKKNDLVLDLCAAPGSKTTQMAAMMENRGTIIANDSKLDRIKILASNLERCGVTNAIITRTDGIPLCRKMKEENFLFDKILVDAPCSGEGTIRSSKKTLLMWNINTVNSLSKVQKKLLESAIEILKTNGEIVYSTCTHAPEENEEVLDFILRKFPNVRMEKIFIPVKIRSGISKWKDREYLEDVTYSCRIYPHVSDTEGFFIAKLRRAR
ncbi:RsmB/NOP family class I SAM-dependent RNA methyltransferase [Candidatus Pacearchaeota archaeon]|nr:RsmB/NOP family class I SAM-dependent RNA methyltransferase [Candidatus Pacearchaeota archaeon]